MGHSCIYPRPALIFTFLSFKILTIFFLLIPWLVFIVGWLNAFLSIFLGLLFIRGGWVYFRTRFSVSDFIFEDKAGFRSIFLVVCIITGWVFVSGAGGVMLQASDWVKHNSVLKDLVTSSWPVVYPSVDGESRTLVYYLAYYLPAAMVGKIAGWKWANATIFLYTLLGTALSVGWFIKLVGKGRLWATLLFVLSGGFDFVGHALLHGEPPLGARDMSHWAGFWITASTSSDLFWSPQHGLSGWILTALMIDEAVNKKSSRLIGFLLVAGALWSPLVVVGLVPLALIGVYETRGKEMFSYFNFVLAPLMAVLAYFYFSSNLIAFPHTWLWNKLDLYEVWPKLLFYYVFGFGLYPLFCRHLCVSDQAGSRWGWGAILVLLACPLYYFGWGWDLTLRASIPSLFVLRVIVARNLLTGPRDAYFKALAFLFVIGSFANIGQIFLAFVPHRFVVPDYDRTTSVPMSTFMDEGIRAQYLGRSDSFFFKYLADRPR